MLQPRWQDGDQHPPDGIARGRGRTRVPAARAQQRQPGRTPQPPGSRAGRLGVFVVIGSAALGLLVTVLARADPGTVLGASVVAGTAGATLAVRPRSVYVIIPVPALAYVVAATIAGLVHDRASDSSLTGLAVHAAQWIAAGFLEMSVATLLAIVATAVRWPRHGRGARLLR